MRLLLVLTTGLLSLTCVANTIIVDSTKYNVELQPFPKREFFGSLSYAHNTDSNFFKRENEVEENYQTLKGTLYGQKFNDSHALIAAGWFSTRYNTDKPEDGQYDYRAVANYQFKLNDSHRFRLSAMSQRINEERGDLISRFYDELPPEQIVRDLSYVNLGYQLGHEHSLARLNILVGNYDAQFDNPVPNVQNIDYSSPYITTQFDYQVGGQSTSTTEFTVEKLEYEVEGDFDRDIFTLLTGLKWVNGDVSFIKAMFGYEEHSFVADTFSNTGHFVWSVRGRWEPATRLTFNFDSINKASQTIVEGNSYTFNSSTTANMIYVFTPRISSVFELSYGQKEHFQVEGSITEYIKQGKIRLSYQLNAKMNLYGEFLYRDVTSNEDIWSYDRSIMSVGVSFGF